MKFTVDMDLFKGKLDTLHKSVSAAGVKPINTRLKVVKENDGWFIDVEMVGAQGRGSVRVVPQSAEASDSSVIVSSDHILKLPDGYGGDFDFSVVSGKLRVSNDKMTHRFDSGSDSDWISLPLIKPVVKLTADIVDAISKSIPRVCDFSKSAKDGDVMSAVKLAFNGTKITLQATDAANAICRTIDVGITLPSLTLFVPAAWLITWPKLAGEAGLEIGYDEKSNYITLYSLPTGYVVTHNTLDGAKFRDVSELVKRIETQKFTSEFTVNAIRMLPSLKCATGYQHSDSVFRLQKEGENYALSAVGSNVDSKVQLFDGNELSDVSSLSTMTMKLRNFDLLLRTVNDLSEKSNIRIRSTDKIVLAQEGDLTIVTSQVVAAK